jgi:hypothetical protein
MREMSQGRTSVQTVFNNLAAHRHVIAALFISSYILFSYFTSLQNVLLRTDDLLILADIQKIGPFGGFLPHSSSEVWLGGQAYFRPFFGLQGWLYYHLFGLSYTLYQTAGLIMHFVATLIFYIAFYRIGKNQLAALLLALVFAAHPYVSVNVAWVSDTATLTGIVVGLGLILTTIQERGWLWHLSMVALLSLAPLTRENGLALNLSMAGYALVSMYVGNMNKTQGGLVVVESLLTTLAYFVYRRITLGSTVPPHFGGSTAVFATMYEASEMRAAGGLWRLGVYSYTVIANIISNFFPIFAENGYLPVTLITGTLLAVFYFVLLRLIFRGWRSRVRFPRGILIIRSVLIMLNILNVLVLSLFYIQGIRRNTLVDLRSFLTLQYAGTSAGIIVLLIGTLLLVTRVDRNNDTYLWILGIGVNSLGFLALSWHYFTAFIMDNPNITIPAIFLDVFLILSVALYSVISVSTLLSLISVKKWSDFDRMLVFFGVCLIISSSVLAFPYFRFRTHYIGLVGWLVIVSLGLRYLHLTPAGRRIGAIIAMVLSFWIVINGVWSWSVQPQLKTNKYGALCDARIPTEVALEVASYYDISTEAVLDCR